MYEHGIAQIREAEQVDRTLLEYACPHTRQHMLAAGAFQDHIVHADAGEQLAKQQAGRARADDGDLRTH